MREKVRKSHRCSPTYLSAFDHKSSSYSAVPLSEHTLPLQSPMDLIKTGK